MNVYDFEHDLDLSKEVEGSIFGVRGIEGSDGIVYAKVVVFTDYSGCERCVDENEFSVYEQAAIEGE